jgi:hypothetical protein
VAAICTEQNVSLAGDLAAWLVSRDSEPSVASKIKYHLGGRVALVGVSLLSLVKVVGRVALGCMAYVGYLITLGYWRQAECFGSDQMQKGAHAGLISFRCLCSIASPKKLANYLGLLVPRHPEEDAQSKEKGPPPPCH